MPPIPDAELLAELANDPESMGYAGEEPDGYKPTKQLANLLGGPRSDAAERTAKATESIDQGKVPGTFFPNSREVI